MSKRILVNNPRLDVSEQAAELGASVFKSYDRDDPYFTKAERSKLIALDRQAEESFDKIAVIIAEQLRLDLTDPRVDEETEEAIEQWDAAQLEDTPPKPQGRLQELLDAYLGISDEILNIRDCVIERWFDDGGVGR